MWAVKPKLWVERGEMFYTCTTPASNVQWMWKPGCKSNQVHSWFIWLIFSIISTDNLHINIVIITFNPISTRLAKFICCAIFSWHSLYAYHYKYAVCFCYCPQTTKGYCTWENLDLLIEVWIPCLYSQRLCSIQSTLIKSSRTQLTVCERKPWSRLVRLLRSCDTVANKRSQTPELGF